MRVSSACKKAYAVRSSDSFPLNAVAMRIGRQACDVCEDIRKRYDFRVFLMKVKQVCLQYCLCAVRHAFADHHATDVTHECVGNGCAHTPAGTRPATEQRVDAASAQKNLQIGAEKGTW